MMRSLMVAAALLASGSAAQSQAPVNCGSDGTAGLRLPSGFCATLFADSLLAPRHMDVAPNGDVLVAIRSTRGRSGPRPGGVVALRDANHDGRADRRVRFGEFSASEVQLVGNQLFTETGSEILRYRWNPGAMSASGPDTIVSGLPGDRSHTAKTFVVHQNHIFVNHGSGSNACQEKDRTAGSRGQDPCPELAYRAGIWRFDANRTGQTLDDGLHFATGIRNAVSIAIEPGTGELFVMQHGRDQLHDNWPDLFTTEKSAETPAEEMFHVEQGDDFGWPYCYFDPQLRRKVLAPEYGGDGRTAGRCEDKKGNVGFFPGHWAPNELMFYTGNALPEKYRNGAFIVFHGSWNRAPEPQQGFKVLFQPMTNGRASGEPEVFVDGFIGSDGRPTSLGGRPSGLAQGPDGALYLSDDSRGCIWKITYHGDK